MEETLKEIINKDHELIPYGNDRRYSDSLGNKEPIELADESFYKPFRDL